MQINVLYIQKCSKEKVSWKYAANLHENTQTKMQF